MNAPAPTPKAARKRKQVILRQTQQLRDMLSGIGDVRDPGEAEEPILSPFVRQAIIGWLVEINNAAALKEVGIKPRSTALLYGPPGTGKTTLAHHLAARMGVPLVLVGSEGIFTPSLGGSEMKVATLFAALAASETPCVVLLDEIDAIGGKRVQEEGGGGARSAMNSTLNVLLRKIEEYRGVLIGATNFADSLDQALWRRFGMQIDVALPGPDERFAILKRYGEPFDFGDDAIDLLTDLTDGAPPSLLRQLMEGVKRLLVVGAKIGTPPATAVGTFRAIVGQTKPHPDIRPPLLWMGREHAEGLTDMPWPPARIGGEA